MEEKDQERKRDNRDKSKRSRMMEWRRRIKRGREEIANKAIIERE